MRAQNLWTARSACITTRPLIPVKTLAVRGRRHVTLGLRFIRTSPDHGTAFDIAGTGKANPSQPDCGTAAAARMRRRKAHEARR